jgi:hypothetical protein
VTALLLKKMALGKDLKPSLLVILSVFAKRGVLVGEHFVFQGELIGLKALLC